MLDGTHALFACYCPQPRKRLESTVPLFLLVLVVSDVSATHKATKQQHLEEKPSPSTLLLIGSPSSAGSSSGGLSPACVRGHRVVQVPRLYADNVEIVRQLASMGAETEIGSVRHLQRYICGRFQAETIDPRVCGLVL